MHLRDNFCHIAPKFQPLLYIPVFCESSFDHFFKTQFSSFNVAEKQIGVCQNMKAKLTVIQIFFKCV